MMIIWKSDYNSRLYIVKMHGWNICLKVILLWMIKIWLNLFKLIRKLILYQYLYQKENLLLIYVEIIQAELIQKIISTK